MKQKEKEVGAICCRNGEVKRELSLQEILLDERVISDADIYVREDILRKVGGINNRLKKKRVYELLLRIAQKYKVFMCSDKQETFHWKKFTVNDTKGNDIIDTEELLTDCYVTGRYKKELLEWGYFDAVVMSLLEIGGTGIQEYLVDMISGGERYCYIYDETQPILMYCGNKNCYSILDAFAEQFGAAFEKAGYRVEYFDAEKQDFKEIARYAGQRFKAIIGMQTYLFSVKKTDGSFLHDEIIGPKYHMIFDHPAWMRNHLTQTPKDLTILTLDRNYMKFVQKYYDLPAMFFPPAGIELKDQKADMGKRKYGLSFLGTYDVGFRGKLSAFMKLGRNERLFLNRFIGYMRKNLNQPPEAALAKTLQDYGLVCTNEEFLIKFHSVRQVIYDMSQRYRGKVIETILKSGITLHVFGDSWKESPFIRYPNLVCHEAVFGEDAIRVYAESELSLNIMSWHKDAFTERIANAMLQKSVVITDYSQYLIENFENDSEVVIFDLNEMEELPQKIKKLLEDREVRECMAEAGYKKAKYWHTWNKRAEVLSEIL